MCYVSTQLDVLKSRELLEVCENANQEWDGCQKIKLALFEDVLKHSDQLKQVAEKAMNFKTAAQKVKVFKALADEIRVRILNLLQTREMCVCEVLVALELTQPTASRHLAILENVGLVPRRREGKWVLYRVSNPELVPNLRKLGLL